LGIRITLLLSVIPLILLVGITGNAYAGDPNTPPNLTVPPDIIINVGESTDPSNTGQATATDNEDPNPDITFEDVADLDECGRGTITRTWLAMDDGGLTDEKIQIITIVGSCPVGGEIIPLDSTMVLAAGAQYTAAWMIPVIVSGIGIGIVIARKF